MLLVKHYMSHSDERERLALRGMLLVKPLFRSLFLTFSATSPVHSNVYAIAYVSTLYEITLLLVRYVDDAYQGDAVPMYELLMCAATSI